MVAEIKLAWLLPSRRSASCLVLPSESAVVGILRQKERCFIQDATNWRVILVAVDVRNSSYTVYDFGEDDRVPYIVMRLLNGEDLDHAIRNERPLTILQKMLIMSEVIEGLHYAHSQGVVHRDVKPANIMLLSDGSVKIMDFGIALVTQATGERLTPQGTIMGSFR